MNGERIRSKPTKSVLNLVGCEPLGTATEYGQDFIRREGRSGDEIQFLRRKTCGDGHQVNLSVGNPAAPSVGMDCQLLIAPPGLILVEDSRRSGTACGHADTEPRVSHELDRASPSPGMDQALMVETMTPTTLEFHAGPYGAGSIAMAACPVWRCSRADRLLRPKHR